MSIPGSMGEISPGNPVKHQVGTTPRPLGVRFWSWERPGRAEHMLGMGTSRG